MLDSFNLSFQIKNTYRVNSIIYSLKHTPLIKKLFSYSLYKNKGIKTFANIVSGIIEFFSIFLGKILYLLFMFLLIIPSYQNQAMSFVNAFVFLTIIGCLLNTNMFNPSIDKYYAIMLLKFNSKRYILSNYIYFLISCFVGFIPFSLIACFIFKLPILTCILIPFFVVSAKNIMNAISLSGYKDNKKVVNENKFAPVVIILVVVLLGLAYGLPLINFGINPMIFNYLCILVFIIGIISLRYIIKYNNYDKMAKELLKKDDLINIQSNVDESYKKQIVNSLDYKSDKEGFTYLNDIFVERHKKLLTKATKNISIASLIIFTALIILLSIFKDKNNEVNDVLKNYLPYYMFIMYFLNRGQRICQTMFMNCDHSMLTYGFFKKPENILSLFKERLKTLIKLNVIPGIIIAIGTTILLYVTGGASTLEYIVTFVSIIAMSIFFSIHYLVLYYLLQPYDVNLDIKNPAFTTICSLTYVVCYMASQTQIPTLVFGISLCLFTLIYSIVSLYLAYKYAPTRFKLRV